MHRLRELEMLHPTALSALVKDQLNREKKEETSCPESFGPGVNRTNRSVFVQVDIEQLFINECLLTACRFFQREAIRYPKAAFLINSAERKPCACANISRQVLDHHLSTRRGEASELKNRRHQPEVY